jgi:uncharacterized membrane protein YfcA
MKRLLAMVIFVACTSFLVTDIAFAQESAPTPEPIKVSNLFTWTRTNPPDWKRGALFAGLGLMGSLVTIFGLIGGAVPGTVGQVKIDADTERLDRLSQQLEVLITSPKPDAAAITAVETTVNNLRDDLRTERWRQFGIAMVLYALLGAFFSALLAQDMLQALVIGAGWTGVLGSLGLKKDYAERKATKDAALEKATERAKTAERIVHGTGDGNAIKQLRALEPFEAVEKEAKIAQRL